MCAVCGGALLLSHVATRHEVDREKNTQDERAARGNCHPKYGCCFDKVRRTVPQLWRPCKGPNPPPDIFNPP